MMFPAEGEEPVIRICRTSQVRRDEQKIQSRTYSEEKKDFVEKYFA